MTTSQYTTIELFEFFIVIKTLSGISFYKIIGQVTYDARPKLLPYKNIFF